MENMLNIQQVEPEVKYWFVRSDSGQHFDTYLNHDFIAIGWNDITVYDLTQLPATQTKQKISESINAPLNTRANRKNVTSIYNKLRNFIDLNEGDIIVIPSRNSDQLAFGIIDTPHVFVDNEIIDDCPHTKKRHVRWLTGGININSLDPTFIKIRKPWHAISEISYEHQYFIDSVIFNLYEKDNNTHFVLRVTQQNEINLLKLSSVLSSITNLMEIVNESFELNEDVDLTTIRINLQSPGLFNIKHLGASLGLVACLLGSQGCRENQSPEVINRLDQVEQDNPHAVDTARNELIDLGIEL